MECVPWLTLCILAWVSILDCTAQDTDGSATAQIYPSAQRVAEGSHVVFTCITSLDDATFQWGKPGRVVDAKRDAVRITQLAGNMSVLEIPRAHVKRHKRTYRCTARSESTQQSAVSNDATLKVMTSSRIHSNYPWITSVRQEDKYQMLGPSRNQIRSVSTELTCMSKYDESTGRPLQWRWIRNLNTEVKFTEDYMSDRIEITPDGHLVINYPTTPDFDATYICVGSNHWGSAYSQPITLNITQVPGQPEPEPSATCLDRDGRQVAHGQLYMPDPLDPCKRCECFYGKKGRCMSVACQAPTCEFYEPSTEKCCEYTCIGDGIKEESDGQCQAYNGDLVEEGGKYQPGADACVTCTCRQGEPQMCASMSCIPPPMGCANIRPVPGKCCEFTCDDTPPEPEPIEEGPMKKVLGHVYVQQIGPDKAIVHWKLPSSYEDSEDKFKDFKVNVFRDLSKMSDAQILTVTDRMFIMLSDLDPNTDYYVMVNASSEMKKSALMTRTEMFSLKPRSTAALVLSESLGEVFESRGAIRYNGYSLPRQFSPVTSHGGLDIAVNMAAFHRVDVTSYNESPCPGQDCGLLRFYSYDMEGETINHVSLMFVDYRDFLWAKAHL